MTNSLPNHRHQHRVLLHHKDQTQDNLANWARTHSPLLPGARKLVPNEFGVRKPLQLLPTHYPLTPHNSVSNQDIVYMLRDIEICGAPHIQPRDCMYLHFCMICSSTQNVECTESHADLLTPPSWDRSLSSELKAASLRRYGCLAPSAVPYSLRCITSSMQIPHHSTFHAKITLCSNRCLLSYQFTYPKETVLSLFHNSTTYWLTQHTVHPALPA
jgi:hypothetical protein